MPFVWDCRWPLDFERLQGAAALLVGTHDFSAMAASRREAARREGEQTPGTPNPVKTIYSAAWQPRGAHADGLLRFRICGSGFLHHMVRNLVGTMVDIGRGSLRVEDLSAILASGNRAAAGPTAPAGGLFLQAIEYDPTDETQGDESRQAAEIKRGGIPEHEMQASGAAR